MLSRIGGLATTRQPTNIVARIEKLGEVVAEQYGKDEVADCACCNGVGPIDMGFCIFCGAGDDDWETNRSKAMQRMMVKTGTAARRGWVEKDLDQNVQQVKTAKANMSLCYWELGNLIARNYDCELWMLRQNDKGDHTHKDFWDFVRVELGIARSHAHELMRISRAFNRDEVSQFGVKKLGIALTVPPESRSQLLQAATNGAGKRQLKGMADDMLDKAAKKTAEAVDPKDRKKAPSSSQRIAVAALCGEVSLPLNMPGRKKVPDRARADADFRGAIATELMFGGVVVTYRIDTDENGNMLLGIMREIPEAG